MFLVPWYRKIFYIKSISHYKFSHTPSIHRIKFSHATKIIIWKTEINFHVLLSLPSTFCSLEFFQKKKTFPTYILGQIRPFLVVVNHRISMPTLNLEQKFVTQILEMFYRSLSVRRVSFFKILCENKLHGDDDWGREKKKNKLHCY